MRIDNINDEYTIIMSKDDFELLEIIIDEYYHKENTYSHTRDFYRNFLVALHKLNTYDDIESYYEDI